MSVQPYVLIVVMSNDRMMQQLKLLNLFYKILKFSRKFLLNLIFSTSVHGRIGIASRPTGGFSSKNRNTKQRPLAPGFNASIL